MNISQHNLAPKIRICRSNWAENLDSSLLFDLAIANPPYIGLKEVSDVQRSVLDFEPHTALFSGDDGLNDYRILLPSFSLYVRKEGYILLEIGYRQANAIVEMAKQLAPELEHTSTLKDLGDRDRCLVFRRNPT